jgi:glutamate-ammonia-ligase adenylyltransferase
METERAIGEPLLQRARGQLGESLATALLQEAGQSADPERGVRNVLRWLESPGGSESRLALLTDNPGFLHRLVQIAAASQAIADSLFQNPELALLLADRDELEKPLLREEIEETGTTLLEPARSYAHKLDRLRYLKQRCLVRIVWNDLSTTWNPESVWRALSDLADGVTQLALQVVVQEANAHPDDMVILAMGKLGSRELNYSSDIDLICLVRDDTPELGPYQKVAESLVSALGGRMGRGFLYRVDYRLRPFGAAGAIVHRLSAALTYYNRYAEPPEILALVRCRPCAGSIALGEQFMASVSETVYRPARSEMFLSALLETKTRYEERVRAQAAEESDLKQGPGGIRDIEFLVNLYQLMEGSGTRSLRGASTLDAIRDLVSLGRLSGAEGETLRSSYVLLRQAEHRIQLRHNLQSHKIPTKWEEREAFARLLGYPSWRDAEQALRSRRRQVRTILEQHVPVRHARSGSIESLSSLLGYEVGSIEHKALEKVFACQEDSEAFVRAVSEEETLRERLRLIVEGATRFVPDITFHSELWDVAFSEEPEMRWEDFQTALQLLLQRTPSNDLESDLVRRLRHAWVAIGLRDARFRSPRETSLALTHMAEWALLCVLDALGAEEVDVVSYGRLGSGELSLASDWDVAFLYIGEGSMEAAHHWVEEALRIWRRVQVQGVRLPLDLRLRPEGGAGPVVRSLEAFDRYAGTAMETWERLALTRARSLRANSHIEGILSQAVQAAAREPDWTGELVAMRDRIHRERVSTDAQNRNIKLSPGFLLDAEWLLGMLEISARRRLSPSLRQKAVELRGLGLLAEEEAKGLVSALDLFDGLRNAAFRIDLPRGDELPPADSAGFARLASALGFTPRDLLARLQEARSCVAQAWERRYGS